MILVWLLRTRQLDDGDLDLLSDFIIGAYREYPLATWFGSEPTAGDIEGIFYSKIGGIGSRNVVDIICEADGMIVGECEIVRTAHDSGVIGIMVRRSYSGRHAGSEMLDSAMSKAVEIGMAKFTAEVVEENKDAVRFFISNGFSKIGSREGEKGGVTARFAELQKSIR